MFLDGCPSQPQTSRLWRSRLATQGGHTERLRGRGMSRVPWEDVAQHPQLTRCAPPFLPSCPLQLQVGN